MINVPRLILYRKWHPEKWDGGSYQQHSRIFSWLFRRFFVGLTFSTAAEKKIAECGRAFNSFREGKLKNEPNPIITIMNVFVRRTLFPLPTTRSENVCCWIVERGLEAPEEKEIKQYFERGAGAPHIQDSAVAPLIIYVETFKRLQWLCKIINQLWITKFK